MNASIRWAAAATLCLSCSSKSRLLPDLPCFDAEKLRARALVFGGLAKDPGVPGGWSGIEVHFGADAGGGLTATVRESGGETPTRAVQSVRYDAEEDSISFTYVAAGNTKFTRTFHPGCDQLVGSTTYFRSREDREGIAVTDTLPRVEPAK